jgi:hypothetical protein
VELEGEARRSAPSVRRIWRWAEVAMAMAGADEVVGRRPPPPCIDLCGERREATVVPWGGVDVLLSVVLPPAIYPSLPTPPLPCFLRRGLGGACGSRAQTGVARRGGAGVAVRDEACRFDPQRRGGTGSSLSPSPAIQRAS